MAKKKPFAGEHFIFADSRALGFSPWNTTLLQNEFVKEAHAEMRNRKRWNCTRFLNVSHSCIISPFVSEPF